MAPPCLSHSLNPPSKWTTGLSPISIATFAASCACIANSACSNAVGLSGCNAFVKLIKNY